MIEIVAVTVLEDRASITRRGKVVVRGGQQRIVVDRVSPVLADKTLTAAATGARVLDIRCERYVAPWREGDASQLAGLRAERATLEAARDAALALVQAARSEAEALAKLAAAALHDLAVRAARGAMDAATAQLGELDVAEAAARARAVDAELEADDRSAALARLDERVARAEAEAGEEAARLVIDLVADQPGEASLAITYIVPGAAWRPYHRAQLARSSDAAGKLDWQTTACIWQATGEDWSDVELHCSLERPSLGVEPPVLVDDELRIRRREAIVVEARDHEQQTAGLGGGPLQVPGIDDGGLGVRLAAGKVTVRADGAPHRVPVAGFSGSAQVSLVAIPLRSPWVHVRVRAINTGSAPLLAGPVDLIMTSGYVGRAEIGFVAPGEKFHLGFGPESEIRVHRSETRERDDAGLLGGWNVQKVRVAVRLSNLGAQRREVVVTERIPISEVEQVDVQVGAADAYLLGDDDQPGGEEITQVTARALDERGLVTWSVELPPHGRRAVTLEYKVKSQRGVAGI